MPPSHILITGASSGIGAALAKHYAKTNVVLCLLGRNKQRLEAVAKACQENGATVETAIIDVTDTTKMSGWISQIDRQYPLDLVIANAGISAGTSGKGESWGQVQQLMHTNIDGVLNTIHPVIPHMKARGKGQIALVSSMASFRGLPSSPAYSASKAAIRLYGEGLRGHLAASGVKVNVIIPGYIKTPMTDINRFPMPGLMGAGKAARIIAKGLTRNAPQIAFPWYMHMLLLCITLLPNRLTDRIFAALPGKESLN